LTAVLAGEIVAGPHIRNACRRHLEDLAEGPKRGLAWDLSTPEFAKLLQRADAIFIDELRAASWYDKVSQAFAVFLPVRSVGAMGDGREIGVITPSGWSPFLEKGVAYARLADAGDATLGLVEVMGFDLAMHRAEIVALPFHDADKRIARGLEAPRV